MSEPANYLYTTHATRDSMVTEGPTEAEEEILGKHFQYMKEMTEKGVVHLAGRTLEKDKSAFGLVVFRAASDEDARSLMENDPGVRLGVMTATIRPFAQNVYS